MCADRQFLVYHRGYTQSRAADTDGGGCTSRAPVGEYDAEEEPQEEEASPPNRAKVETGVGLRTP